MSVSHWKGKALAEIAVHSAEIVGIAVGGEEAKVNAIRWKGTNE